MTHKEASLQTKTMLCTSLKKIMKHKAFSKITVSELIADCNVNRKTFYYHFEDIYDLLKWMFEQEAFAVVNKFDFMADYKEAFDFVLDYVESNAYFLNCIYDSVGRDELKRFLYQDFIGIMEKIVQETEASLQVAIAPGFRDFLCNFYTEALAGMLINLFQEPDTFSRDELYRYISVILYNSMPAIIQSAKCSPEASAELFTRT